MRNLTLLVTIMFISGCTSMGQSNSCAIDLIVFGGFGSGCGAQGSVFELTSPKRGKSIIYIYRTKAFYQKSAWPDLFVNDISYGQLKNGGFAKIEVSPGKQLIEARRTNFFTNWQINDLTLPIECEADQVCFVRITATMDDIYVIGTIGGVTGHGNISLVPKHIAIDEISSLKKIEKPNKKTQPDA
mgnify:FL=1